MTDSTTIKRYRSRSRTAPVLAALAVALLTTCRERTAAWRPIVPSGEASALVIFAPEGEELMRDFHRRALIVGDSELGHELVTGVGAVARVAVGDCPAWAIGFSAELEPQKREQVLDSFRTSEGVIDVVAGMSTEEAAARGLCSSGSAVDEEAEGE